MKKLPLNPKLVGFLAALLFALVLGQSILEYRSGRRAVLDSMNDQAKALILSVARASERGLMAYEAQQSKITQQLYTVADMIDWLDRTKRMDRGQLRELMAENGLSDLLIFNSQGKAEQAIAVDSIPVVPDTFDVKSIADVYTGKSDRRKLGLVNVGDKARRSFAVALRRSGGGAIVVGIDGAELLTFRRTLGAGSVIADIDQSPGVKYGGIIRSGILVAASKSFSRDSMDEWYNLDSVSTGDIKTRIRHSDDTDETFEAMAPFTVAGESYGNIVIGIDTAYLDLLTAKLRRDIFWRSILFLIVAMIAVAGVILRQNYGLLSNQYAKIQKDVRRLEADKALSAKLVAMGELAGGVAHEIRNPLNAIRVIIQRLEREFKPQNDETEYKELTSIIRKETDKINESVKNFLTLARPPILHKTMADLNQSIKEVVALFQPRAHSKGCYINADFGNLPRVLFDPELIHQAILNLLENALAVVDSNGRIDIKTFFQDRRCVIQIADNGPGIEDDEKPRVFDLYYTTKPTGTGMGLPMVLRIIKEHGGTIDLSDGPTGGALFRLELPSE
jgi:signal transduction histidine kinase